MIRYSIVLILFLLTSTPYLPPIQNARALYETQYNQVTITWNQVSDADYFVVNKQDATGVISQIKDLPSTGSGPKRVIDYNPHTDDKYSISECYWNDANNIHFCQDFNPNIEITYVTYLPTL